MTTTERPEGRSDEEPPVLDPDVAASVEPPLFARTCELVERFLETVVVIDDNPVYRSERPPTVVIPPRVGDAEAAADRTADGAASQADAVTEGVDALGLVQAFANRQIVCAVLDPGMSEQGDEWLVSAAAAADVVVLDWQLGDGVGDGGSRALKILDHLVSPPGDGRLRLVVVYTSDTDLEDLVVKISGAIRRLELLDLAGKKLVITESGGRVVDLGPLRVAVVPKYGNVAAPGEDVKETDLPAKVIDLLARKVSGLLGNTAIAALTAIRENTDRLLARFHPEVDAPFLTHRVLTVHRQEPDDFVLDLLVQQIQGLVFGSHARDELREQAVEDVLRSRLVRGGQSFEKSSGNQTKRADTDSLVDALLSGLDDDANRLRQPAKAQDGSDFLVDADRLKKDLTGMLIGTSATGERQVASENLDFDLCRLSALAREAAYPYGDSAPPRLTIGTILARDTADEETTYWLCLQPACDAVGLGGPRHFPLLRLVRKHEVEKQGSKSYIVLWDLGAPMLLVAQPKLHRLENVLFEPERGAVLALQEDGEQEVSGVYVFRPMDDSGSAQPYRWVADLRSAKAAKLAQDLAADGGRVGIDEYDWLRRGGA